MSRYVQDKNRNQLNIFSISLDEMISDDNSVRVINIVGVKELIKILKAKKQAFFNFFYIYIKSRIVLIEY